MILSHGWGHRSLQNPQLRQLLGFIANRALNTTRMTPALSGVLDKPFPNTGWDLYHHTAANLLPQKPKPFFSKNPVSSKRRQAPIANDINSEGFRR
jgi:hypothetical protein